MAEKKTFELKEKQGVLFRNNTENTSAPTFKGYFLIEGEKYSLGLWDKSDKNGNTYYSFSISKFKQQ